MARALATSGPSSQSAPFYGNKSSNGGGLLDQRAFNVHKHTPWAMMVGPNQGELGRTKQLLAVWALRDAAQCGDRHAKALRCAYLLHTQHGMRAYLQSFSVCAGISLYSSTRSLQPPAPPSS